MTYTLAELVYYTAAQMDVVTEGSATGGSVNTIIDTNDRDEDDDTWNEGTAVITYDSGGEGAAPQWEYGIISDFSNSTHTITLKNNLTAAVSSGDRYAIWKKRYSLNLIIQSINRALQYLGKIPIVDTATITTENNKTEYTMPGAATLDLRKIWYQYNTNDSDNNDWRELKASDVSITNIGSASKLIFPYQLPAGHTIKLLYVSQHPRLVNYNSQLSEAIHPNRVIYRAAYYALKTKNRDDDLITQKIVDLENKDLQMEAKYPIMIPRKTKPGLMLFDDNSNYKFGL